jgi:hypothetical protein
VTDLHIHGFKLAALVVIFVIGMAGGLIALGERSDGRAATPRSASRSSTCVNDSG